MRIGFAMCGSFCTFAAAFSALEQLAEQYDDIFPIMSEISQSADTRFGTAREHVDRMTRLCGKAPATSIVQSEPIGPKALLDLLIIAPCTGNTLSKMAQGITDSTVTMAAKAQLRNQRPVSSNDGLGASGRSIVELMVRRNVYFVPFGQDDPVDKPQSLKADMTRIPEAVEAALRGQQLEPVLIEL